MFICKNRKRSEDEGTIPHKIENNRENEYLKVAKRGIMNLKFLQHD